MGSELPAAIVEVIDGAAALQKDERGKTVNPAPFRIYQESSSDPRDPRLFPATSAKSSSIPRRSSSRRAVPTHARQRHRVKLYHDTPLFPASRSSIRSRRRFAEVPCLRGRDRHRPHRSAGLDRRQLCAGNARWGHRRRVHQLRSRRRAGAPAAARPRRPVVIDFIDMESQKNQREVENTLRDALRYDRADSTWQDSRFD